MATVSGPGDRKGVRAATRTAGLRRAREAKQLRDARRRERELALEAALVDYYTWLALVDETRDKARKRAGRILAEAEDAVQMPLAQAGNALRRLRDLGETREAIRELTQISSSRLREILTHAPRSNSWTEPGDTEPRAVDATDAAEGDTVPTGRMPSERPAHGPRYEGGLPVTHSNEEATTAEEAWQESDYVPKEQSG